MAIEVIIKIDGIDAEEFIEVFEFVKKRMLEEQNEEMQNVGQKVTSGGILTPEIKLRSRFVLGNTSPNTRSRQHKKMLARMQRADLTERKERLKTWKTTSKRHKKF